MEKKVNVYVMRHGHKDAGSGPNDLALLSRMGEWQILESARNNLMNLDFHGLYCSLKYRTLQSVVLATSLFKKRNNGLGIETRLGFDYDGAPGLGNQFIQDKEKVQQMSNQQKTRANMEMWIDTSPLMVDFLRSRLTNELKKIAIKYYCMYDNDREINILSSSHELVGELAYIDPKTMFPLREADIVKYVLIVERVRNDTRTEIISSEFIDRGF